MADKELEQERRRLRGKLKVKLRCNWEEAAVKRFLSMWFFSNSFAENSHGIEGKEIEEIIDDEEFVLLHET